MRARPALRNWAIVVLLIRITTLNGQTHEIGLSAMSNGFSTTPTPSSGRLISSLGQSFVNGSSGSLRRVEAGFLPAIQSLAGQLSTTNLGIQGGWNLVSVPLTVSNYAKTSLFPTSTSQAFAYQGGYVAQTVLANGSGYWLKFGSSQNVPVTGVPRGIDSIAVLAGWNLIGSISTSLPVGNVGSIPGGIVTSQFFGYTGGGYAVATTIDPGKAYWVKVGLNGTLILSSSSPADALIRIVATSELPPPPPGNEAAASGEIPAEFGLEQNYPNPFNPVTTITFDIPNQADGVGTSRQGGTVSLQVFDVLGRQVATLADDTRGPGRHSVTFDASNLATGTYIYRLTAGSFTTVKRMILLR